MKSRWFRLAALLLAGALWGACSSDGAPSSEAYSEQSLASGGLTATLALTSDWGSGYCAQVNLQNTGTVALTSWSVGIEVGGTSSLNLWSGTAQVTGTRMTVTPASFNAALAVGATTNFGYCVNSTVKPTLATVSSSPASGGAAGNGGSAGTAGAAGSAGKAGSAGASGSAGSAGVSGSAGASGSAGKAGSAGASGSAGSAGVSGSAGASGTKPITVWIAGDSTVANGSSTCPIGWGKYFSAQLNSNVTVNNSAAGGRSVRTWLYSMTTTMGSDGECVANLDAQGKPVLQARWQAMLDGMKSGDYLFIQFGINDASSTCDRHVGLARFKTEYGMMAAAAKARGAQPVFVTPVSAIACSGSTAKATRGSYVTATKEAGVTYGVPVIDLHQLSIDYYNSQKFCPLPDTTGDGVPDDISASTGGAVGTFFCTDHTHFDTPGATQIAKLVASALRTQGLGLAAYLK